MAENDERERLDGTQQLLLQENGHVVARIRALSQSGLAGTHFFADFGKSVCRESVGVGLIYAGLAVLVMADSITPGAEVDMRQLIDELITEHLPPSGDDIPF